MSESPSVGQRLRAERERKGSSLPKVADALRLDPVIVAALEEDDYARVGPAVFVKGHLRRYAELLGLPPEQILAGYQGQVQPPKPSLPPREIEPREIPPVAALRWPPLAAAAALVLLGVATYWLKPWHGRDAHAPAPQAAQRTENASGGALLSMEAPPAAITAPPAASTSPHAATSAAPRTAAPRTAAPAPGDMRADVAPGTGRARLRLSFSADSWVDVHDASGRRVYAGNGRANSVKTLSGDAPMHIYLRYASGVQLEINNRAVAIGRQFMAGEVARFEAGADGVLRRENPPAAVPVAQARDPSPNG